MRKIFLSELPRYKDGRYKGKINWKESIGFKLNFIYDDIEDCLEIIDYIGEGNAFKAKIKYNKKDYIIDIRSLSKCCLGNILNKYTSNFRIEIGQTFKDNKRDIAIIDRKYIKDKNGRTRKMYKYKCNKCGFDGGKHWSTEDKCYKDECLIEESSLLHGGGCSCCNGNKIVVEGINDITTTASWMVKYFQGGHEEAKLYAKTSRTKINPICPCCGKNRNKKTSIKDIYNHKGFNCPFCSDNFSYPNKFMFNLLKQLNIEFETEYSPNWIKPKRYDFYIPSKNLIIEMDGGFHNKDNNMNGQTAEESKEIDNYKDKLAKEHGIRVIRIDCDYYDVESRFDYIKNNIINSKLNEIFDLNDINWNECSLYSESSLIIEVINLKKYNPKYTTGDIKKLTVYSIPTIIRWLKIGNELKLCNYSTHQESERIINENSIKNSKEVKMYKDGKYIDTFKNSSDLQKISQERFGVLLYACEINRVCNKRKNSYKGYYFEFVNDKPIDEIKYKKGKQVEVFKEGVSLGIYESCNELSRKSLNDFGVEFLISEISNVCNGKRKSHKGYTFKYIK